MLVAGNIFCLIYFARATRARLLLRTHQEARQEGRVTKFENLKRAYLVELHIAGLPKLSDNQELSCRAAVPSASWFWRLFWGQESIAADVSKGLHSGVLSAPIPSSGASTSYRG